MNVCCLFMFNYPNPLKPSFLFYSLMDFSMHWKDICGVNNIISGAVCCGYIRVTNLYCVKYKYFALAWFILFTKT